MTNNWCLRLKADNGTWCVPCVKEMPSLQSFHEKEKNDVSLFTLSYNSRNLDKFMSRKGYTFSVLEVDQSIIEELEVKEYPTKIIITPNGFFFKIPYTRYWEEYVDQLVLKGK
ncbi:MAG: TlpA disulfide reductase family protein [Bacteroidota bacterium]